LVQLLLQNRKGQNFACSIIKLKSSENNIGMIEESVKLTGHNHYASSLIAEEEYYDVFVDCAMCGLK
jgi:hypothetical protein